MSDNPRRWPGRKRDENDPWRTAHGNQDPSATSERTALQVRCPFCQTTIEASTQRSFSELDCTSCGERFSLVGDETQDRNAHRRIGHFELIQLLGKGSFGSVWKALDTQLDRHVAIKIPRSGQLSAGQAEQFLREARAAAQLTHPNIVGVHEVGRDGERIYIVCDLIQGSDLFEWLGWEQLTPRESAELCIKIAGALQHAHERGIIHRDLKPHNIMMDNRNEPFLMDFGLARRDAGEMTMTIDGQILGTPAYMSPEQARGEAHQADQRTDIYSLGVILYQLLTREVPFRGQLRMVLNQVLNDDPPSPRKLSGTVPRDLETICLKCMEKEPQKRYATATEVSHDLQRFLRGEPIRARPITRVARLWRWCQRNPVIAGLAASVATLIVAGSIGAAVYSYLLYDASIEKIAAQTRADQERFNREAAQRAEDAADFAMLKEQIRAERWVEADHTLMVATERLKQASELAQRQAAWRRLHDVARFYQGNDTTWNNWGEENYAGVMQSAQATLHAIGALAQPQWWEALPSADLDADEQQRLEQEVYRLLMLHSAVQSVVGSVLAEQVAAGQNEHREQAIALFQAAIAPIERAQSWELQQPDRAISITSNIMEQLNRGLLERLGQPAGPPKFPDRNVSLSSADNYFLGLMFFVVQRSSSAENPLCLDGVSDTEHNLADDDENGSEGLLSKFLRAELTKNNIPQAPTPLESSEWLLRIAAGSERRYWPNFALGRTLFFERKFAAAELTFSTCVSLRPDYARSFEQRALMRALQANEETNAQHAAKLRQLAREDSDRALLNAARARDPSTWWPRGDLHALLDEPAEAFAAYFRALEWEDDIRQKVNRRNNLGCVERLAQTVIAADGSDDKLVADAMSILALSLELTTDTAESIQRCRQLTAEALKLAPEHPHALTVRGRLRQRADGVMTEATSLNHNSALEDFETALEQCPTNYLAAVGRAEALEALGRWQEAELAWKDMLAVPAEADSKFAGVAITAAQRARAQQGLHRAASPPSVDSPAAPQAAR